MANGKFSEMVDPRLLEAAFHRLEAARALAKVRDEKSGMDEKLQQAWNAHQRAVNDYDALEGDIARGVRSLRRPQAVQS